MRPDSPRWIAAQALTTLDEGHSGERWLRAEGVARLSDPRDRRMARRIYQGASRSWWAAGEVASALSKRPWDQVQPSLRSLIRVGLFELSAPDGRVPARAVVHEVVECAKRAEGRGAAGFCNGILRSWLRGDDSQKLLTGSPQMPQWMEKGLREAFGGDANELLNGLMQAPTPTVRWRGAGTPPLAGSALWPGRGDLRSIEGDPTELPGWKEEQWAVQDGSAVLCAELLQIDKGDRVVDLCAAPGGKSLFFADRVGTEGRVEALDKAPQRLGPPPEGGGRATAPITWHRADLEEEGPWQDLLLPGSKVFLDAPCTSLGTLRRHPEILVLRREGDAEALGRRQERMLEHVLASLPYGELVYAVCSWDPAESLEVLSKVLSRHPRARLVPPPELPLGVPAEIWRQLLRTRPDRGPVDAFVAGRIEVRPQGAG